VVCCLLQQAHAGGSLADQAHQHTQHGQATLCVWRNVVQEKGGHNSGHVQHSSQVT
jgi:hypothetical protein